MSEKLLELFVAGVSLAVTVYQAAKGKSKPLNGKRNHK